MVDGLYNDDPERQVVAIDKTLLIGGIRHRVEQLQELEALQQAMERRNQGREERLMAGGEEGEQRGGGEESQEEQRSQGEGTASTLPSELEREDERREKTRLAKKRKIREEKFLAKVPYGMLRRMSPLLTSYGVSHVNTAKVVAAFYNECNIDLEDVVTTSHFHKFKQKNPCGRKYLCERESSS